jgi:GNAT superfamily N-acetyltransferase
MLKPAAPAAPAATQALRQGPPPRPAPAGFAHAVQSAMAAATGNEVAVRPGENLTRLVHAQAARQGVTLTDGQAHRWAQQVAQFNRLPDADRIYPGQRISLQPLAQHLAGQGPGATAPTARADVATEPTPARPAETQLAVHALASRRGIGPHPVLERVLQRAVDKGYVPAADTAAVRQKIVQLAQRHGFTPDDFARVTLMESDGLNPRASNGSCHGIIQFCDGPNRGAASVGHAEAPERIRALSALQQLDLVDAYLSDVGNAGKTPLSLDDLYLSILTPAARAEPRRHAALPIAAPQAAALHVGQDTSRPITRQSLVLGLYQHAQRALRP